MESGQVEKAKATESMETGIWTGSVGQPRGKERERREKLIGRMGVARSCGIT